MSCLTRSIALTVPLVAALIASPVAAQAQDPPPKEHSALSDALQKEKEDIVQSCSGGGIKVVATCGKTLATDQPIHLSFGSLAPQSGFATGLAVVSHKNFAGAPWRFHGSGDAVVAPGGSWRAGAYFNFDHVSEQPITVVSAPPPTADNSRGESRTTVYSAVVQSISLDKLLFFGLGPDSLESGESNWGLSQTIVGGQVFKPVPSGRANLMLIGSVRGRFVDVRGNSSEPGRSITDLYDNTTAPGLGVPSARFAQFGESVRLRPSVGRYVRPSYTAAFDQFLSNADARASFNRFTLDLTHQFPLYRTSRSLRASDQITPNECSTADDGRCDPVSYDRDGSITIRFLTTMSWAHEGDAVPFYLQPTLGGSDINGTQLLSGFSDYRFRAPNFIALQERFDHSLWFWEPLGFIATAEQGRVALAPGDLSFSGLRTSAAVGLTVRAGGFPQVFLVFGWSNEGHHIGFTINPSLLGGGSRPSLF